MKKNFWSTFIFLSLVFLSTTAFACRKEPEKIQLEIKQTSTGNAAYTGEVLFFRVYANQEVEFDSVRNTNTPISESNLIRKKMTLSKQDADEIQNILAELNNSNFNKHYSSTKKQFDVGHFTEVIFTNAKGENSRISFQDDVGGISMNTDGQGYPKSISKLLTKILNIRSSYSQYQ